MAIPPYVANRAVALPVQEHRKSWFGHVVRFSAMDRPIVQAQKNVVRFACKRGIPTADVNECSLFF